MSESALSAFGLADLVRLLEGGAEDGDEGHLRDADAGRSQASWALRWVMSLDAVQVVLSGMTTDDQMADNLATMTPFQPLNEKEQGVIRAAQQALNEDQSIACTSCHYCTKGCPMNIPIPEIFTVINRRRGSAEFRTLREYAIVTEGKGKASDCIACGQCEAICPQHLPIISLLEKSRELEA